LIKATIPDQLLAEWFTKSLLPPNARAQYLDLVYSQSNTLYELISNAPRPLTNPSKPSSAAHADGVIGCVKTQASSQSTDTTNRSVTAPATGSTPLSSNSTLTQVSEVNAIQFVSPQ
jgi:hypothetical protein